MNLLLIVVAAIIILMAVVGWKKGFIRMAYALLSIVLAIVLTILLSPLSKNLLMRSTKLYRGIYTKVEDVIDFTGLYDRIAGRADDEPAESTDDGKEAVGTVDRMLETLGLPKGFRDSVVGDESFIAKAEKSADSELSKTIESLESSVYDGITRTVITAISFVVTLIVVGIIIFLLGLVFNLVGKLPIIRTVNKFAGGAAGAFIGFLIVWVLFAAITMLGATAFGQKMLAEINSNPILSYLYNNNIVTARIFG